jgi:hypothetical protein
MSRAVAGCALLALVASPKVATGQELAKLGAFIGVLFLAR